MFGKERKKEKTLTAEETKIAMWEKTYDDAKASQKRVDDEYLKATEYNSALMRIAALRIDELRN